MRPKTRGRPAKYYHPLLQREKQISAVISKVLPKPIADSILLKGCRLAHLYGLPKAHKEQLAMCPIPSATHTYNYALAKWLNEKLKPLSCNQYTVTDTFEFVNEVQNLEINRGDILVSYDVTSLFTNVPLNETIQILADQAFTDDWFNKTHDVNLSRDQLIELLHAATKNQLFQFNGNLCEETDGVAMSLCAPLKINSIKMANCPPIIDDMWMTHLPSSLI